MIILIPLEIGVREIYSKTFLAFHLAKKYKAKIYLFNSRSIFKKIKKLENCIIFDKSLSYTKIGFHENLMKKNFLYSLDEEGPVYNWDKFTFLGRNPDKLYKNLSGNFLISEYEKKYFKKKQQKKLFIVGHPKYDLLKKPYINLYSNFDKNIKKNFGNYIYFSSSYGFDTIGGYEKFLLFSKKIYLTDKKNIKLYDKFLYFQKNDFKNYILFMNTIKKVAYAFPKKKIIFRPHPSQDIDQVKKRLKDIPKNLHVIYEKDAVTWIKNCEYYIHSHCTTSIDAALLNKKILRLVLTSETEHKNNPIYNNLGYNFQNSKSLISFLAKSINYKKVYKLDRNNISQKYLTNNLKQLSSDKIGNIFFNKIKNKKSILEFDIKKFDISKKSRNTEFVNFLKRILKKIISNFYIYQFINFFWELPANILLSKEYKEKKMNNTNLSEIPKIINKLNNLHFKQKKKNVKFKKLNEEIYQIS